MTLEAIKEAISELSPDEQTALADWIREHGAEAEHRNGAAAQKRPILGWMKGTVKIHGDIVGPTGERWEADE